MAKKRSQPSRAKEPPEMDNLQVIDGIGPAIERRLHSIGIYTFAQLAALSPADIAASVADIAGLTTERINKQNWISQARHLASKHGEALIQSEISHQHIETLLQEELDEEVTPFPIIEDSAESIEAERLPLQEVATSSIPMESKEEAAVAATAIREKSAVSVLAATRTLSGQLHLRDLEMLAVHPYQHHSILRSNHPFRLRVMLDLEHVVSHDTLLSYNASIFGKQLSSPLRQKMGEAHGLLTPAGEVAVEVEGIADIPGFYRLEVIVSLSQEGKSIPGLIALIEGGPLRFY